MYCLLGYPPRRGHHEVLGVSVGESTAQSVSPGHIHGEYVGHGHAGWIVGWKARALWREYLRCIEGVGRWFLWVLDYGVYLRGGGSRLEDQSWLRLCRCQYCGRPMLDNIDFRQLCMGSWNRKTGMLETKRSMDYKYSAV